MSRSVHWTSHTVATSRVSLAAVAAFSLAATGPKMAGASIPCGTAPYALQIPEENLVDVPVQGAVLLGFMEGFLPDVRGKEILEIRVKNMAGEAVAGTPELIRPFEAWAVQLVWRSSAPLLPRQEYTMDVLLDTSPLEHCMKARIEGSVTFRTASAAALPVGSVGPIEASFEERSRFHGCCHAKQGCQRQGTCVFCWDRAMVPSVRLVWHAPVSPYEMLYPSSTDGQFELALPILPGVISARYFFPARQSQYCVNLNRLSFVTGERTRVVERCLTDADLIPTREMPAQNEQIVRASICENPPLGPVGAANTVRLFAWEVEETPPPPGNTKDAASSGGCTVVPRARRGSGPVAAFGCLAICLGVARRRRLGRERRR